MLLTLQNQLREQCGEKEEPKRAKNPKKKNAIKKRETKVQGLKSISGYLQNESNAEKQRQKEEKEAEDEHR